MNKILLYLIFLVLFIPCPAWTTDYYVKTGGNDEAAGTSDALAWATVAKVSASVTSGDTVYFRSQDTWTAVTTDGEYILSAVSGVTYDGATYGTGTRAKLQASTVHMAVVAIFVSNVTLQGFEVDGGTKDGSGIMIGSYATGNVSNVTVDNCVIHNIGETDTYYYGIHIGYVSNVFTLTNVTVKNTDVHDCGHEGIAIYPGWDAEGSPINDTVLIRACIVYNTGIKNANRSWGDGISIANDSRSVTLEWNHLYSNFFGVSINAGNSGQTVVPTLAIIRYNIIHDNLFAGISVNDQGIGALTASFYGNLIYNNGKTNYTNLGADIVIDGTTMEGCVLNFYNNTIYSTTNECPNAYGVVLGYSYEILGSPTINFKNNIVYTGTYTAIRDIYANLTHSNNLVFRSSGASDEHVNNGTSYNRAGVTTWEATAQNTDPTFVGGTLPTGFSGTYGTSMIPNSPYFAIISGNALNNGATLGSPYNGCINGAGLSSIPLRPAGTYDIGAYELYSRVPWRTQ